MCDGLMPRLQVLRQTAVCLLLAHDSANYEIGIMHEISSLYSGKLRVQIKRGFVLDHMPDPVFSFARRIH